MLWRKLYRNRKPRFLSELRRTETEVFWSQVNTVLPSRRFCLYTVQRQWVGSGEATEKCLQSLMRLNFPIWYLSSYAHAWKCMVSASNQCEVYRQRWLTQDLLNAIIYSAGSGLPWITGTGECSNSIESVTQISRKFALAWQLGTLGLWCSLSPAALYFAVALPPAVTGVLVQRDLRCYILTFIGGGGKWVRELGYLKIELQKSIPWKFHR